MIIQRYLNKYLNKENTLLLLIASSVYLTIYFLSDIKPSEDLMFAFPDARSYLGVGNWLFGNDYTEEVTYWLSVRPFLYPLIVLSCLSLGGYKALLFCHFVFWILAFLFVYKSIKMMSNTRAACIGSFFYLCNFSTILATYHALTETAILMLFSFLIYLVVKNRAELFHLKTFHKVLFVLVLMVLIKPVFSIPMFTLLAIGLMLHFKKYWKVPKRFFLLLLILIPILVQMSFIKYNYDKFTVSVISGDTIKLYLMAQSYAASEEAMDLSEARLEFRKIKDEDYKTWIMDHPGIIYENYKNNLGNNIQAYPVFLAYPEELTYKPLKLLTENIYFLLFRLHKFMFYFSIPVLIFLFIRLERKEAFVFLIGAAFLAYFILTTGVSFYQGDRLVLPSWGVTIILYTLLFSTLFKMLKQRIKP